MKIGIAQINPGIATLDNNVAIIKLAYLEAIQNGCDLVIYPELATSGYNIKDLAISQSFVHQVVSLEKELCQITNGSNCGILVGTLGLVAKTQNINESANKRVEPTMAEFCTTPPITYNTALFIQNGIVKNRYYKHHLPNYDLFDEKRQFCSISLDHNDKFFTIKNYNIYPLICEDMWHQDSALKRLNISSEKQNLDQENCPRKIIVVLNASPFAPNKRSARISIAKEITKHHDSNLIYVNQVGGQDEVVFDGDSFVMNSNGEVVAGPYFATSGLNIINTQEFKQIPKISQPQPTQNIDPCHNITNNQSESEKLYIMAMIGLRDYILKHGFSSVVVGLSGGIDSAFVATLACDAIGSQNIYCVRLPSEYTSQNSLADAAELATNLECNLETISIENLHTLSKINLENTGINTIGVTNENIQARLRGLLLMAIANSKNHLLLATSNKSECAVGYATLYGDMCGGIAPIADIYKTEIYQLAAWRNQNLPQDTRCIISSPIPEQIIAKAPTAELAPNQKDQDSLPEYQILDSILYLLIEKNMGSKEISAKLALAEELVQAVSNMLHRAEFKRKQSAVLLRLSNRSLGYDRRYPTLHSNAIIP